MRIFALSIVGLAMVVGIPGQSPIAAQSTAPNPATKGRILFLRCASCHAIDASSGGGRIGPNLAGVVGRKAGSLPEATYSAAMKQQSFVWNEASLDRWLTRPSAVVPGTSMAFAGLSKPEDRAAVIAYLANPGK